MRQKSGQSKAAADKVVKGIRRKTRKHYSAEEKIRVVQANGAVRRDIWQTKSIGFGLRRLLVTRDGLAWSVRRRS